MMASKDLPTEQPGIIRTILSGVKAGLTEELDVGGRDIAKRIVRRDTSDSDERD